MCIGLATSLAGCNLFRKSTSTTKAAATGPKIMSSGVDESGGSLSDTIGDQNSYILSFAIDGTDFKSGLASVEISLSAGDSSVFERTRLTVSMGVTIRHADGSAEIKATAQPIASYGFGLSAQAVYAVKKGDVVEIAINGIPDELKSGSLYAYVSPLSVMEQTEGNELDFTWDAQKIALAGSNEESVRRNFNVSARRLFTFESSIATYKPSGALLVRTDSSTPCHEQPGAAASGSISSLLAGKPWSAPLVPSEARNGSFVLASAGAEQCEGFKGAVSVETDAAPATFESKVVGLTPNETYVQVFQAAVSEDDFTEGKLGLVEAPLGSPGDFNGTENTGRYEKQKMAFRLKGVTSLEGLRLSGRLLFPLNLPDVAASTFNGSGIGATLRHASGPKAGEAVTDSKGVPLQVFKANDAGTSGRTYFSFEEARVPDLDDGDYEVSVEFPSNFPSGVFVNSTLVANRLVGLMDELSPATIADFKARDAASGAVVHEWPKADYSTAFNPPKREPIAMVAVAKAMEELRDAMHLTVNRTNPWTGIKPAMTALNVVDWSAVDSCLGSNEAPHWSDLTLHYYCQINEARGCYTGGIRDTAGYMQKVQAEETAKGGGEAAIKGAIACRLPSMKVGPVTLPVLTFDPNYKYPTLRQYVFAQCATDSAAALDSRTVPASAIPGCLARKDIEAFAPSVEERTAFSWFMKDPERAKVFRYIMEAPTFAFDEKDQQDLINAFYRVTKPTDPSDCAKRSRRAIDNHPSAGMPSLCEVGHEQNPPRAAAGR